MLQHPTDPVCDHRPTAEAAPPAQRARAGRKYAGMAKNAKESSIMPHKSPLCYIGGKSLLAKTIIDNLPPHATYCEVFAGAAWVFYTKEPSKYEILNDINSDLVMFYRVIKHHLEEFVRQLKWCLLSREWWDDWTRQLAAGALTDIQRAARYYYIQRMGFGGKVKGRTFGAGPKGHPRINLLRMEEELLDCHLRLARATIEHMPYEVFLERYDRKTRYTCSKATNAEAKEVLITKAA